MKNNIIHIIIIVALLTLCVIRFFVEDSAQTSTWIPFVNYLGIPIAAFGLYNRVRFRCGNFTRGIFVIIFCILTILAVLILTNLLVLSAMVSDLILLVTLLISLPSDLYCKLLCKS